MEKQKQIKLILSNGEAKAFPKGITVKDVAESLSISLGKLAVGGKVNGKLVDVSHVLDYDAELSIFTLESEEGMELLRHSCAHILAQAVKRINGNVQLGIGPVIEDGFYYDMCLDQPLALEGLKNLEKEMSHIIAEQLPINRIEVSFEEAEKLFQEKGEVLKLEILNTLPKGEIISLYQQGEFIDLCRGPHLPHTGFVKAFQLTKVAGAYWKGDNQREMLQRIYGVAFPDKAGLKEHQKFIEEAKKRDHRKLGKQLELFSFFEEAPGMPFYLPKGQIVRQELENFSRQLQQNAGYEEVRTPFMMNQQMWEQSGHWDHYKDNMYFSEVDETKFALKPMNCPGHMLIFKNNLYSYRDLPVRFSEFGQVHRHEYSGALNGMLRVRTFCQDDAHLFVRKDQIEAEIKAIFQQIDQVYSTFGFDYSVELSTRPEDSLGNDELWETSEQALSNVLENLQIPYAINKGDGAFYGPKIDFHIKDALKRSHQCATIQLDFQMPEKFGLFYINEWKEKVCPVVIHRAIYGSIDRFFGILIEHFAGSFPIWLAPIQVQIIPVASVHEDYCLEVQAELKALGIRSKVDGRNEKLGYKIRESQMQKIPYILVLGDEEKNQRQVNVRKFGNEGHQPMPFAAFKQIISKQINEKSLF
ncbi:threonine--tRNA ligase [Niallia sp. NCCP-28]|uniref:threonine--tRNA ligase n=1 Tax=Niallia sp. NCCP-28 TaxID=2934712 RepID=UPI0020846F9B|nr:threonine--tRNA ligase [Niallia sp. NCCP-28]GKU82655.1 threonine--tRNA ligase 2 [Niallia sp. NCCP-28]